ncbi:DEAD/DEAH box helicase [Listeria monocytogenes]|nr:DEAD/DEAH box helicase [Listeria monocytogenes]EIE8653795.1 DEAD/DEAH box helicase [Listeria monocytogenes]HBL6270596.1 DEAD/DEAH box helicase [Listeria monocytogenes]HBL6516678.1 DEAD/DEAH box helicase [Listeria monocytogenes]HBL8454323.1 DEAD/DEAH box helicase [Listeria monocytogenes]
MNETTQFVAHDYQEYAINKITATPKCGLFLDMGMGKTVTTLTAISELMYNLLEVSKVLVIAPLRVAEDTWSRETEKWSHTSFLQVSKILGPAECRKEALNQRADIYVINRENLAWLVDHLGKNWDFDMVVVDEFSSFKNSKSQRFKALRKVMPKIKRLVGLTGTPAPNTLLDLWPQIYLLDRGERLGKTKRAYLDKYFTPGARNGHVIFEWRLKNGAEDRIHRHVSDICVSMKAEDWLEMPERIDSTISIKLPSKARAQYSELEKEFLLEFEHSDVVADSAAVLSNKLLQLANGAIYDENQEYQEIHSKKLEALADIIEESAGQPVLVFYSYKHDEKRILNHLKQYKPEKIKDSRSIRKWNAGKTRVLLAHPASAGHGLNLQDGGHIVVWFGLTWSLELYQQANARLFRQGQKKSVIVHHIVAKDTLDEKVIEALNSKKVGQDALLEAVKARLEKVKRDERWR